MSGLEIAGVVLGAFPLIISSLEHWHEAARTGGLIAHVQQEYMKRRHDLDFHQLMYKRNLQRLLIPIATNVEELIRDPEGHAWRNVDLQARLQERLSESYQAYIDTFKRIHSVFSALQKELCFDDDAVQERLMSPVQKHAQAQKKTNAPAKSKNSNFGYQRYRVKFGLNESRRNNLFAELNECNDRLEKLLSSAEQISALQSLSLGSKTQVKTLELAIKTAWEKSDLLFKAIQGAWRCSCQDTHTANLRLEHRTTCIPNLCFELILMYFTSRSHSNTIPWTWQEVYCAQSKSSAPSQAPSTPLVSMSNCPAWLTASAIAAPAQPPGSHTQAIHLQTFSTSAIKLCHSLAQQGAGDCIGSISQDEEIFHLHRACQQVQPHSTQSCTLAEVLRSDLRYTFALRQRYSVALLLASSVAQLSFTPWLRTGLSKEDVMFHCDSATSPNGEMSFEKLYIRQNFSISGPSPAVTDLNFYSLGILLVELCFCQTLEDSTFRKALPAGDATTKPALDFMAAHRWSKSVPDGGGTKYASAVDWCFDYVSGANMVWHSDFIENVIRPLEVCKEQFEAAMIP